MSDKSKHTTTTHTTTTTTPITSGSVTKDLHDMRVSGAHESAKKDAIASEKWESAKENARIAKEASKQAAIDAAEASSNKIGARKDGAKETVAAAGEKVIETKETAKELAKDVKDKVVEKAEQACEAVAEAYDRTADEINDANARAKQNMAAERERASRVTPTVTHHTVTTTSKPVVSDVRDRPSGFPQHQHHTSTTTPATTQTIPKAPPLPASNISHKSTTSTATSVSSGQPVSEKVKDKAADLLDKAGAKVEQGKQQVYEAADQTKKSAEGAFNSGRQLLQDARDTIVGSTHNMVKEGQKSAQDASTQIRYASDRSAEAATDLRSKMIETKEQARQLAHDTLDKAREKMEPAADSSDKLAQQRGIQKAQETEHHAASLLERVKDSVSHLFDAGRHAVMDAVNPEAEDEDLVVPKTGFVTTSTTSSDLEPRVPVPASETSAHATRGSSLGMSSSDAAGREAANVASRPLTQMQTSDLRDAFGSGSGGSSSLMEKDKDKSVGSERADKHMERLEAGDYKVE